MSKSIVTLYFSGTGNTKYLVDRLHDHWLTMGVEPILLNMEKFDPADLVHIEKADLIQFAYPVYGSMAPMLVWQFLRTYAAHFENKKGAVVITQWMASGDGGAYLARILKKCKMNVVSIEHFNFNNNISDVAFLSVKNGKENEKMLKRIHQKIELYAMDIVNDRYFKIGNQWYSMLLGSLQRVPFSKMERKLAKDVKIDNGICSRCGLCTALCPTENLTLTDGLIVQKGQCTLCYRCVNQCPEKAISLFSKHKPKKQYKGL